MEEARSLLETQGYRLNETHRHETHRREQIAEKPDQKGQLKTTNIVLTGNQIILFKQAAELLAQTWERDMEKQGNQAILKLPVNLLGEVEAVLIEDGFEIERKQTLATG